MNDNIKELLSLDNSEKCKSWLIAFDAHCRSSLMQDNKGASGTSDKTDTFLHRCGTKAIL